jgi:hypothetical protein
MAGDTASASSSSSHPPAAPAFPATRQEIQAAIAKATELRALHAALLQGAGPPPGTNAGPYAAYAGAGAGGSWSPAVIRVPPAASPALPRVAAVAEDYPVFTPVSRLLPFRSSTLCNPVFQCDLWDVSWSKEQECE